MQNLKFLTLLFFISLFAVSCSKDEPEPVIDKIAPVINITSPVDGAILERGKTYPLSGTVTDDTELAEISGLGFKITSFDSKTSHVLTGITIPIATDAPVGNANITITATDKEGNAGTKTVTFKIQ